MPDFSFFNNLSTVEHTSFTKSSLTNIRSRRSHGACKVVVSVVFEEAVCFVFLSYLPASFLQLGFNRLALFRIQAPVTLLENLLQNAVFLRQQLLVNTNWLVHIETFRNLGPCQSPSHFLLNAITLPRRPLANSQHILEFKVIFGFEKIFVAYGTHVSQGISKLVTSCAYAQPCNDYVRVLTPWLTPAR